MHLCKLQAHTNIFLQITQRCLLYRGAAYYLEPGLNKKSEDWVSALNQPPKLT